MDEPLDDECTDENGDAWPEHDFGELECQRCGAEALPEGT